MKAILHQIVFVVATAAMGAACFGADTLPPPNQSAQTPVGDYGSKEALVIEGNQTFSKDRILGKMALQIDYHLAAHPAAPLADYLVRLERMITLGYQHAGFPEVTVKAVAEPNAGRVVVQVNEGPRFRCGEILLSGVKTMTNEVVRRKIADVLDGLETATGSQSNLDSTAWLANQPAALDEFSRQSLTKRVQEALAALNYYRPKVSVGIVLDPARKLADLKIEIADEGIKGTVAEIEVSGLYTNTRPQLLEYLKLKPGMEVNATLVAATSNQLWRSARFFRHNVSLVPLPPPGQFKLTLDLDEVREAPPLTGEFSPKESALLKFRDWLEGWETRPEDMVVSISFSNSSLRGHANLVLSPSGTALTVHDTTSNSAPRLQYAFVASEKLISLYSVWRRSKFTIPRAEGLVLLKITPASPNSYGKGNISFGVGLNAGSTQPFRLEMDLQPAVFLSMAHWMDSSLNDGVITLTQPSEYGGGEFRINAATGRLLRATWGSLGSEGSVKEIHPEEGALARQYKEIAPVTADHPNRYVTNRGFSSWAAFAAEELMESPLIGRAIDGFTRNLAPGDGRTDPTDASRQIKATLVLIREFIGQQNLEAVFEPLDQIFAAKPENDDDEEVFIVPMGESQGDPRANPMAGIGAWVLSASDTLVPRHSWPWVLLRESAFIVAGQAKYTQAELEKQLKSEDIGPAGCLATAYLLGRINPRLARAFAERGLTRLTPAEFHRDYRLLLRTNSIVGDMAGNALGLLEDLGEARLTILAAGLGTDESAFARDLTRLLLDAKGQPPGDAVWPAFEQHWDKVPRRHLEVGLRRFLPQVQYLTNSQALYERGLMLISPDSPLQDPDEAVQCFRKAADQGHAGAQLQYGALCERGQGVPEDFAEAMRWYRKAAEKKQPHAACHIGALYHEGKGVHQDPDEAAKWYRLEADGNCARAQFRLGRILEAKLDTDAAVKWYRRAAEGGATAAQAKLGDLLSEGVFSTPDYVEACQWLSLAAQAGDKMSEIRLRRVKTKLNVEQLAEAQKRADAITETAQAATRTNASNIRLVTKGVSLGRMPAVEGTSYAITLRTKDSSLGKVPTLPELRTKAEQRDAKAQFSLGILYYAGDGVVKDYVEAAKWFRKAAEQGYAEAQYNLGIMFKKGHGVVKDYVEAAKWYRKAAEQGYANAQSSLGVMYTKGDGVAKDYVEAIYWYRKASKQGDAGAQYYLGSMYDEGNGVVKDHVEAARWYRKAAEQGHAKAQYNLGLMYYEGDGVMKDYVEAIKWYRKAAEQGDADAQSNLGLMYANGDGVLKDQVEAYKWFRNAAEQGDAKMQYNLGLMYARGDGVLKDQVEAYKWFHKAAEQGAAEAQSSLGVMYRNGDGVVKDHVEAYKWFRKAAEQGYVNAQSNLGFMYEKGNGVVKDELEAYKWWLLAGLQGEESAKRNTLILERRLTADQRAEGQRLAREFKPLKQ